MTTDPLAPIPFGSDAHRELLKRFWRVSKPCLVCDQPIQPERWSYSQVYCSKECQQRAMTIMRRVRQQEEAA